MAESCLGKNETSFGAGNPKNDPAVAGRAGMKALRKNIQVSEFIRAMLEENDAEKLRAMIQAGIKRACYGDPKYFALIMERAYGKVPLDIHTESVDFKFVLSAAEPSDRIKIVASEGEIERDTDKALTCSD